MDRQTQKILDGFKKLTAQDEVLVAGVVKSAGADTCTVTIDGLDIENVRLRSAIDSSKGLVIIPAAGANVTIAKADAQSDFFIIACNKAATIKLEVNDSSVIINDDGIQITKGTENLKTILNDLITEILKIYAPMDKPAIIAIKERLNTVLT